MEIENPQIFGLMAAVLKDVESIAKSRRNEQQGYKFRGIDEVYDAIHSVFAKHQVFSVPRVLSSESFERETRQGGTLRFVEMRVAYDFFAPDGSSVTAEAVGEAMDSGDKASNKAMSAAHKYAILQTFCIPTGDTPDADATTHDDLKAAMVCPECGKTASVIKGRAEYGGGWVCYKKKGGCGAKFFDVGEEPIETSLQKAEKEKLGTAVRDAAKVLNTMGDTPPWTEKRLRQFANDNFNITSGIEGLTGPQLGEMAALLSKRIDEVKLPTATEEAERHVRIAALKALHKPETLAKGMRDVFPDYSGTLETLTLEQLLHFENEFVPF